ncbi:hypothetical protein [Peribacillus muralis]|uniref:hypothetical protein n=1 Tax=Peribacillus muralis TaxID=264697 RepID=UPI003D01B90C
MDNLQIKVLELVQIGGISVKAEDGKIELSTVLKEAVAKQILPFEVLEGVDIIINQKC